MYPLLKSSVGLLGLVAISRVAGHGSPLFIETGGKRYDVRSNDPNPGWKDVYDNTGPHAYLTAKDYDTPHMNCHWETINAKGSANVKAGDDVTFEWDPMRHVGIILTYMANCRGPCEPVDRTTLKWFKIHEAGIIRVGNPHEGQPDFGNQRNYWATQKMYDEGRKWTVQIPKDIVDGSYVMRNEVIALHFAAGGPGKAQHYPYCANFNVSGGGTVDPVGLPAGQLYKGTDPGIDIDVWGSPSPESYKIPGPPMYNGATSPTSNNQAKNPSAAGSSSAPTPTTLSTIARPVAADETSSSTSSVETGKPSSSPNTNETYETSSPVSPVGTSETSSPVSPVDGGEPSPTPSPAYSNTNNNVVSPVDTNESSSKPGATPTSSSSSIQAPYPSDSSHQGHPCFSTGGVPLGTGTSVPKPYRGRKRPNGHGKYQGNRN